MPHLSLLGNKWSKFLLNENLYSGLITPAFFLTPQILLTSCAQSTLQFQQHIEKLKENIRWWRSNSDILEMKCVFTKDRNTPRVFSEFVLGPVQEVLFLFIFIIFHHYPCMSVCSLRIESVEQSTEIETGHLVNSFFMQFIYVVVMESGN